MVNKINRRKVLSMSGASISAVSFGIGKARADSCTEPDWLEDGSRWNYDNPDLVDSDDLDDGWVYSTTYMLPMFTNGNGESLFHGATAVFGFDDCGTGNYEAMIKGQGTKIEVNDGSLYASMDPERVCVWPDTAGPAEQTNVEANIAWTAIKGAVGLANMKVGAAILAADLFESAVFTDGHSDELNNGMYYAWGHTNNKWLSTLRHNIVGHFIDFFIMPETTVEPVKFNLHHYINTHQRNIYDSSRDPLHECEENYEFTCGAGISTQNLNNRLTKGEIESLGLPEEFVQGGPVYRVPPDRISMRTTN
ncbi:hypothetical protein [Halostella sp. PRR32]|uniref:hypothetical protein n=1 Tax=Halostella sp. PRR32 TaxID=3098147 RepID=UPI002B1D8714|nr:hypothetical protein [Halostella sp. PRR32]